jgi:hypothetical protein
MQFQHLDYFVTDTNDNHEPPKNKQLIHGTQKTGIHSKIAMLRMFAVFCQAYQIRRKGVDNHRQESH